MATATWNVRGAEREVRVEGDLDHAGCGELAPSLEAAVGVTGTVVLRMEGVGSICSRGVTMLLGAYHRLRREGRTLLVTGLRPQVREVLDRLGVFQVVPVWDPEPAAHESHGGGGASAGSDRCATAEQVVEAVDARSSSSR